MAALFSCIGRLFGGDDKPSYDLTEEYIGLRELMLSLNDKHVPELSGKYVRTVLMEAGGDRVVTVVATADGTASIYFSDGGGKLGFGREAKVRSALLSFIETAEAQLKHMKKTDKFPVPKPGETIFYVSTSEGVFTYSARIDDLVYKRDKLFPLFYRGNDVAARIRIIDEKQQQQDESESPVNMENSESGE